MALTDLQRRAMWARGGSGPEFQGIIPSPNAELKAEIKRNRRLTLFKDSEPHQLNFFSDKIKQGGSVQFVSGGTTFGGSESFQLGTPLSERKKMRVENAIEQLRIDNEKQERKLFLEQQKRAFRK